MRRAALVFSAVLVLLVPCAASGQHNIRVGSDLDYWDDLRVSPNSLPDIGANSPQHVVVSGDGSATSGIAASFNGSTSDGTIAHYADLDAASISIAAWIKVGASGRNEIIDRDGADGYELFTSGADMVFSPGGGTAVAGATDVIVNSAGFAFTEMLSGKPSALVRSAAGVMPEMTNSATPPPG